MADRDPRPDDTPALDARELAARAGTTPERVADLVARDVLTPAGPDRFVLGDIHRMRVIDAFERAGVPLDALVDARVAGRVSFDYYDELHVTPSPPSERTYDAFRAALGPLRDRLPMLFDAFGIVEPAPTARLEADEEALIEDLLEMLEQTGRPETAMRTVRLFAEANRRAAEASLGVYAEVAAALGEGFRSLPPAEAYAVVRPWARIARFAPTLARWLATQHMSHAVDAYSAEETERTLEELGFIPERPTILPGIAFVDLTGFTRLSEEAGDETAAGISLRLGELARATAARHGGRVVKLLGDGVLLRFPDAPAAVDGSVALLAALPAAGLPPGHAGVHCGRVIEREGDVFGRTVNLASRIADVAPAGSLYVSAAVVEAIADGDHGTEAVESADLQGIGPVPLFRVLLAPGRGG
jgi:adenylate cyclase